MMVIKTIDVFLKECYIEPNIPARPLPKGMLNYGGFYNLWTASSISAIDARFAGMMGVPAGRAMGMCWEVGV
jgi:hypothetical protein